ncbi:hypothetical protein acsn021_06790 [Anaerocolumna cellulosilytica]|uniref:Uncharacterized protein n=1 Tax=Anaerocolumna cellulosilytica TaxID=433286 RepID=A0A6S6R1D1_9FIRM|nr:Ig-like domain-containing protein [Anaerocolumna cellulosilytica]MBB5197667.1 hypothetical protein [Anaerocolumna cellulosilytica]BCJ93110.1 hypothetical protein acsn021_06790 [Anaerocolumna cellulosilytica]
MKKFKKWSIICAAALLLSLTVPTVLPVSTTVTVQASAVKISQKKLTLKVGASKVLKLTGSKDKATWNSSNESVAAVSKNGKVTAKKAGTVTITATVSKRKYTCKVTVTEPAAVNPFVKNAPFEAKEGVYEKLTYVMPKDFTATTISEQGNTAMIMLSPSDVSTDKGYSSVVLTVQENGSKKPDYSITKETLSAYVTENLIKSQFAQQGVEATVTDFKSSDYESELGTAYKTEYQVSYQGTTIKQTIYDIFIDNYFFEVTASDVGDKVTPDINIVASYLLDTLKASK